MMNVDYSIRIEAFSGRTEECGDTGFFIQNNNNCFISHIDALGHNANSYIASSIAVEFLQHYHHLDIIDLVAGLHENLKGTVGIVGFFGVLNLKTGIFEYSGIGNIKARIFGFSRQTLILKDGIIGYSTCRAHKAQTTIFPGDIIILTSDGIKENYLIEDYPDLLSGNSNDIASAYIRNLSKDDDDASCSVLRYLK